MDKKIKNRIICCLAVLAIAITSVSAVSYSAGLSLGVRDTSLYDWTVSPSIEGSVGDFDFGLNFAEDSWIDGGLYYNGKAGNTFRYEIGTGFHQVYGNGGMWALTADCGQDFLFADHWILNYAVGVQMGVSWSKYSDQNSPFSLSPYLELEAGYRNDFFTGKLYWCGDKLYERTWQSLPILGAYMSFDIADHHQIFLDTYFKMADYMRQPDILISSTEFRIGYRYHGGEN